MVQTLEAIKGGGGSMKVGTTGTISVLMSRELESMKSAAKTPASSSCTKKPPSICSFVAGAATSPKRMRPKASPNEASSSSSRTRNGKGHKSPEVGRKTKNHTRKAHEIPILEPETSSVDEAPVTQKSVRRGLRIVEIMDIKCGSTDKPQASPLKNPLKKVSFSKLSGSPV
ncbi:PREDICTED: uncharacterized protein LOC109190536 [Ipomoea nil]|uniref:uncharacterized protein LOC109190536 n=1 Tax=Ipomoea nil TaxID=35883 RepID=UPI0009016C81|nr:PREDICTED: uncharacterized protein LOC109190536 [Ipomoea nil]